ncbi:MAG: hypothetical protein IPL53_17050 [Ignavibacteria bacterium]|nr:hypothetical protein [Ignavibacteria bacterium]
MSWSEFREMKLQSLLINSLNNTTIKGGINFSRLYNLNIPGITETNGFNLSYSMNKGITNELGMEVEVSADHMNINQDLSLLMTSPNFNAERNIYFDPVTQDPVNVGNLGFEK